MNFDPETETIAEWWLRSSICDPYLTGVTLASIEEVSQRRAHYLRYLNA